MLTFDARSVDDALSFADLIEKLRLAFRSALIQPTRHHHRIVRGGDHADTTLLIMPAWTDQSSADTVEEPFIGVKVATVSPDNNRAGKPAVMANYLLLDGKSGEPLAIIDGQRLTLWRTACASALASSYLARQDASKLLVIGAGALAPFLAEAHCTVRPIRSIRIWNRNRERAETVAEGLKRRGIDASAVQDIESALADADIISCATLSTAPLVRGDLVREGTHVDLVGAFTPAMRESDDTLFKRARIYVDTRAGALAEAGDVIQAIDAGVVSQDDIVADLFELARNEKPGRRSPEEITVFKSVGAALEDLAAAQAVFSSARSG